MTPEDLTRARTFVARAEWVYATTYSKFAQHEYVTRWTCRARGMERDFEAFAALIESDGYWRPWGHHRWRSLNLGDHFFWLHWNVVASVRERTVINRWWLDAASPEPAQLSFEVES